MAKQTNQLTLEWDTNTDNNITPEKLDHFLSYCDAVRLFKPETTNQELIKEYLKT